MNGYIEKQEYFFITGIKIQEKKMKISDWKFPKRWTNILTLFISNIVILYNIVNLCIVYIF